MGVVEELFKKLGKEYEELLSRYKDEIATLRVGAVDLEKVKNIEVDAYGTNMPVYQVATVMSQSALTIVITPWDKKLLDKIAEAVTSALKDVTPTIKGDAVYLNFPPLTEEKRKEYLKLISKLGEHFRQQLRDIRNRYKRQIEEANKSGEIPDSMIHKVLEKLDSLTRQFREEIDKIYGNKEKQILNG